MPSPLTDEEGDFILIHHEDLRLSQKAEEVYTQLQKMLLEQQEVSRLLVCLPLSVPSPFISLGKARGSDQIFLDSNSGSSIYWLCDLEQGTSPLRTTFSSPVKWDD